MNLQTVLNFIVDNWSWLSVLVYEIIARLLPTQKSVSLINAIKVISDKVIPNLKRDPQTGDLTTHK